MQPHPLMCCALSRGAGGRAMDVPSLPRRRRRLPLQQPPKQCSWLVAQAQRALERLRASLCSEVHETERTPQWLVLFNEQRLCRWLFLRAHLFYQQWLRRPL